MEVLKKAHFTVASDLKVLNQVLSHFNGLNQPWIPKKDWLQCRLALAEGFTNAVRHAHKELSKDVPIVIEVSLSREKVEIRIWDYGSPFDLEAFVEKVGQQKKSPTEGGHGIEILQKIADDLKYIRTDSDRNCLLIVKQFSPIQADASNDL